MWRRRREKARARAARPDAGASGGAGTGAPGAGDKHLPGRIPVGAPGQARRAWRMDRRGAARVALTPPAEFSRRTTQDQPADMVPAPAGWPANGRLGRNMASVYCILCGQENPEGARYCSHCGNPLAPVGRGSGEGLAETTSVISAVGIDAGDTEVGDEPVADAAMLETLPAGTAMLVVRRGPNAGSRFLLDSDLTLDDVTVSRRLFEFYRSDSRFTVRDVGSLNGTYVNRERIEETDLTGGDEGQVGKFRLVFLLGPYSQAEH